MSGPELAANDANKYPDSQRYPLSFRLAMELEGHFLCLETLAMILKQPAILSPDLERRVLKALGRLVVEEIELRLGRQGSRRVRLPLEVIIRDPKTSDGPVRAGIVLYDDRNEQTQGWFVWIGSVWDLVWPRLPHKPLRGDQIDLDELEHSLNDLIVRVIASIPMELLAIYVPGGN